MPAGFVLTVARSQGPTIQPKGLVPGTFIGRGTVVPAAERCPYCEGPMHEARGRGLRIAFHVGRQDEHGNVEVMASHDTGCRVLFCAQCRLPFTTRKAGHGGGNRAAAGDSGRSW